MPDAKAAAELSPAEREHVLFFKPLWQRALVAAAGPLANFVLAIVLMTALNLHEGHNVLAPVVGDVVKDSPAEQAGIKAGDRITAIDGRAIDDFEQLPEIIGLSGGHNLAIGLTRAFVIYLQPEFEVLVPYLLMVLVLLVRPFGLFGAPQMRKI